jgi:4-amino-4-deoxy-L-arabinose transferase-like glycosyltransferase
VRRPRRADLVWAAVFAAIAALYAWRLEAWRINDDEGSYLYAAWRISLGELPYRDFLTPQLPAFLVPGGLLMRLFGPTALVARALAVVLTLGTGWLTWATARRLFGPAVALLAGTAALLHPTVFLDYRTYRPDPFMLFFAAAGVWLFARGVLPRPAAADPPDRRYLALAGAAFGLATLAKLFGPLPLGACLAWLVVDAWQRRRPVRPLAGDMVATLLPAVVVVAAGLGAFALVTPGVLDDVVGHHLRQGAGLSPWQVVTKGIAFYTQFLRYDNNALLAAVAIAVALTARGRRDRRVLLLAWQIPTALAFLAISRALFVRHLVYLVPALGTLLAVGAGWLADGAGDGGSGTDGAGFVRPGLRRTPWRWLTGALVAGLLVPWLINDWHQAWEWETGTRRAGDFISLVTPPDDLVLSDYSELNFYARRPTTYAGASLSEGAVAGGQTSWASPESAHRLRDELGGRLPRLLVLDTATEFAHLGFLPDRDAFLAWVAERYGPPAGYLQRHHQVFAVYAPVDRPLPVVARFAGGPALLAAAPDRASVAPGGAVTVRSAWQAPAASPARLVASIRLRDDAGREWALGDDALHASATSGTRVRTTDAWSPGELVADRTSLVVPPGTPPGSYTLVLGVYRQADLVRLDALDASGQPLGQSIVLGRVTVTPGPATPPGAIGRTLDRRLDDARAGSLRLLGRGKVPTGTIEAGTTFPLDLWWQTSGPVPDVAARVTLDDATVGALAADATDALGIPGAGTSTWPRGGIAVRQLLRVPVRADAASGTYRLGVTPVDGEGTPLGGVGPFDLGTVTVAARDLTAVRTEPPPVGRRLQATLGAVADLYGVDAPTTLAPGAAVTVTLVWRALTTPPVGYKVTVQVAPDTGGALTGAPVAQHDGEPDAWRRPTTTWLPGEYVIDAHPLMLPRDLAPGRYVLVAGMYHPETLVRLPVTGADGAGDVVRVGVVEVR